jgi:serine phosphatase RsbU (regulator of sigma subunit)
VTTVGLPGTLLGMFSDVRLREQRTELRPGQILLIYTDSLVGEGGSFAAMSEPDLGRLLAAHRDLTAEQLESGVRSQPQSALRDDIAFLVLRVVNA